MLAADCKRARRLTGSGSHLGSARIGLTSLAYRAAFHNLRPDEQGEALSWHELRHFHKEPKAIAIWLRTLGPVLRWLTPSRRRLLLSAGALIAAVKHSVGNLNRAGGAVGFAPDWMSSSLLGLTLLSFVLLCLFAARNFASLPASVRLHPQICLHALFWLLLAFVWMRRPGHGVLGVVSIGCIMAMPFLLWRVGYMMFTAQRGRMADMGLRDHFFYIFPVWGGSDTPYGKGFDYLTAYEARDETALAKSQLAGVKCFLLAGMAALTKAFLAGCVFGEGNVLLRSFGALSPPVPRLGAMFSNPGAYPVWLCWIALYAELLWAVLALAASGHVIIGWVRLFGFHVFRNTYKPLLAESVVEFWNRYYYYFKELLVNFFFYPTFARHFKGSPRLRIFAAVFAAAFFGNMYYHWLRLDVPLVTADFAAMWAALQSRLFYCLLLTLGIYISMQREQRRAKTRRRFPHRVLATGGVWTFFSIIHIWAEKDSASFFARVHFFLGLLGFR